MKLNKDICRRCINERNSQGKLDWRNGALITFVITAWDEADERIWNNDNKIWCRNRLNDVFNINEIPNPCAYKLEHVVINEKKN